MLSIFLSINVTTIVLNINFKILMKRVYRVIFLKKCYVSVYRLNRFMILSSKERLSHEHYLSLCV